MLATCPGHSATVLVALAFTGGMPTNNSVGKEMKLPPPATELMAPRRRPQRTKQASMSDMHRKKADSTSVAAKPEECRSE